MDFSKKGVENKQRYIKSTSRRLVSKTRITLFRLCIVAFVGLVIIGVFAGYGYVKGLIDSAPDITQIDVVPQGYKTKIRDRDGVIIDYLYGAQANREYVYIKDLPDYVKYSFICVEDERFYEHSGIDIEGIFRAAMVGLTTGRFSEGASTITQQLLKNQVFGGGFETEFTKKLERKIQEQYLAIQLENALDKDTIMEYYLNTINLGSRSYGIQTAAKTYFNKNAKDLTRSEAATIAAIAQSPVYNNPITHPESNKIRKDKILGLMLEQGHCSQEEYDEAMADDVYTRIQAINSERNDSGYNSYFVDALIEQILDDFQSELGYTEAQAYDLLYSGGLEIYSTQDTQIQDIVDGVYSDESNFPEMGTSYYELTYALSILKPDGNQVHYHNQDLLDYYKDYDDPDNLYIDSDDSKFSLLFYDKEDMQKKIDAFREAMMGPDDKVTGESATMIIQPQSSFVVMDQHTGEVVALVGGRGEKKGDRTLNRATDTKRQPGSTFKVLSTYLPALDSAGYTLANVQDDSGPYYYQGTDKEVSNWTSKTKYDGLCTLRKGIYDSMNIVTVKTLTDITAKLGYDYLLKLGFTTLVESEKTEDGRVVSDINLPLALGGLTYGVKNLELTAAYAAIANGGVYTEPIFYTKVLDRNGNVLLSNKPKREQVMKDSTAWLLTSAMEDVVKIGTGTNLKLTAIDMPVAGKTGSTSDYKDLWFAGFSPYYTATVWSGCDNPRSQTEKTYPRKIWKTIMEQIHIQKNLEKKDFSMPDSIVTAKICTKSGKLAKDGLCDKYEGGSTVKVEYFARGTEPTEYCDAHVKVKICTKSKALANEYCPDKTTKEVVLLAKEETGVTKDTPYVVPKKHCTIHKSNNVYEDEPAKPDGMAPQTTVPESTPNTTTPDTAIPETIEPDYTIPDAIDPEADMERLEGFFR